MKFTKLTIALAATLMLVGCAGGQGNGGNGNNNSESVPGPVIPDDDKYSITLLNEIEGVTLSADKQRAKKGETVTITVNVTGSNVKISKVLAGSIECTKVNETTYTFVMPDNPVKVKVEVVLDGDVTLQGDISATFVKEGNLYVARNVKVSKDSNFDIIVKSGNATKKMTITSFDRFKTFANITFGRSLDRELHIVGGATYDFYYDTNNGDRPCYVKRTSIDRLPNNATTLENLFYGSIQTESSVNPDNLVGMKFTNGQAKETIEWHAYNDGTSLATVSENLDGEPWEKAHIYASLKDGDLTVVDDYTPGNLEAYKSTTFQSDTKAYSGQYKVADVDHNGEKTERIRFENNKYFLDEAVAQSVVDFAPVSMQDFDFQIMKSYRLGFVVEDEITQADVSVKSTQTDAGFDVEVKSSNTYDSSKGKGSTTTKLVHKEFRTSLSFDKAGALLSGKYLAREFGPDKYDFNNHSWLNGLSADDNFNSGRPINRITIEYTYGEKTANDKNFNPAPYLVSSISNVKVGNPKAGNGNNLNLGDKLTKDFVSFEALPKTALNKNQYRVVASSNKDVIAEDGWHDYYAKAVGSSEVSIGIINGLGAIGKATVNVVDTNLVRTFFMDPRNGEFVAPDITAEKSHVFTGQINEFGLATKSSDNKSMPIPLDTTLTIEGEAHGFTVRIDHERQSIIVDGTHATFESEYTFKVRIDTSRYDESWSNIHPVYFYYTAIKGVGVDALIGTWTSELSTNAGASIKFSEVDSGNEKYPLLGRITCTLLGNVDFMYGFNPARNEIKATFVDDEKYGLSTLNFVFDSKTHELSVLFVYKTWDAESQDNEPIFGEEQGEDDIYDIFKKAE